MWKTWVEGKEVPGPGPAAKGTDLAAAFRTVGLRGRPLRWQLACTHLQGAHTWVYESAHSHRCS